MMITKEDTRHILESIKAALTLSAAVNQPMIDAWHSVILRYEPDLIEHARDELIREWSARSFPNPHDIRTYISLANNQSAGGANTYDHISTSPGLAARVNKLRSTSERNIDIRARNKDTSREPCFRCGDPALMNLIADDYFEYWEHPVIDSYKGKYLCNKHTAGLNESLHKCKGNYNTESCQS